MHAGLRARQLVNLANGSTLAGLGVAVLGRARVARGADGLFLGTGYRLPVPPAPAFCLGNVIVTRLDGLDAGSALFRHEARHATQYAWCGGVLMVPLYLAAAAVSWALTGDFGARNVFERRGRAGRRRLHRQTPAARPPAGQPSGAVNGSGRLAGAAGKPLPWPASVGRDGSTASPSR